VKLALAIVCNVAVLASELDAPNRVLAHLELLLVVEDVIDNSLESPLLITTSAFAKGKGLKVELLIRHFLLIRSLNSLSDILRLLMEAHIKLESSTELRINCYIEPLLTIVKWGLQPQCSRIYDLIWLET